MEIDLILRARDAHDVTTTVSATVRVDPNGSHPSAAFVETIVGYARAAAERLSQETQLALDAGARAPSADFVPWADYIARGR